MAANWPPLFGTEEALKSWDEEEGGPGGDIWKLLSIDDDNFFSGGFCNLNGDEKVGLLCRSGCCMAALLPDLSKFPEAAATLCDELLGLLVTGSDDDG